jgi:hypothetical protein
MLKLSLKTILSKKNETASIIASLIERLNASVWIEDDTGNILLGNNPLQELTAPQRVANVCSITTTT